MIDRYNFNAKYVLVELCNFDNYPLGGHLTFAKQLVTSFRSELALVGVTTDDETPVGVWTLKEIDGYVYEFYSVKKVSPSEKKGVIPKRIKSYFYTRRHRKNILRHSCKNYIIQTPEVFFNFNIVSDLSITLILPGLSNPLQISRYSYSKAFAKIYEYLFFKTIDRANILLAAADNKTIVDFVKRGEGKFDAQKIHQFPTRYDDTIFNLRDKNSSKIKIGVDRQTQLIVTSGRLNYYKGWEFMLEAYSLFQKNRTNSVFVFLGEGEDRILIERYVEKNNLKNYVKLIGKVNHYLLSDYLNAADLFVMGSFFEGWSTSLVEAIACATPVCVTDFSSAKDLVNDGFNGYVIEDRNVEDFSNKMELAIQLPKEQLLDEAAKVKKFAVSNLKAHMSNYLNLNK